MKTLTQEQIDSIKSKARQQFVKSELRIARDEFHTIYQMLNDKTQLSDWTLADVRDIMLSFKAGCKAATKSTCSVIRKIYFQSLEDPTEYEDYEFCRPCFFNQFCSGNPENRNEDGWHWNMMLLRNHLKAAGSPSEVDKQYVRDRWNYIKDSTDLQDLHDLVEGWGSN
jgi:hypothetical protein